MARYEPGLPVRREHLTTMSMAQGNELHIDKVVLDGRVREWVGFGWIDITDRTAPAARKGIPVVTE